MDGNAEHLSAKVLQLVADITRLGPTWGRRDELLGRVSERLNSSFVNYVDTHNAKLLEHASAAGFIFVGKSFIHVDLSTGFMCLLTCVKQNELVFFSLVCDIRRSPPDHLPPPLKATATEPPSSPTNDQD